VKNDPTFWLIARASGLTAYALLTVSVLAGLVLKSRPFGRALRAASVTEVHRFLALLGLLALVFHGLALVADRTVKMPLTGLLVPGSSPYRPVSVALGVVSGELMALVVVSFSLRRLIGQRNWRRLHWATYLVFALATAHGLLAGSDSAQPWARDLYLGAVSAVAFATAWRAVYSPSRPARPVRPAPQEKGAPDVPDRDRRLAVQRVR
jgi:sulfoxide reductase heme-binding subunit YedZ